MKRLAVEMLIGDTVRYFGIVAGVAIAAFLISQQLAMMNGILDRLTSSVSNVPGVQLWVMDANVRSAEEAKPLPDAQLARVRGVQGVAWAVPLHKGTVRVRLPNGNFQAAGLRGIDDVTFIGGPAEMVAGRLADLRESDGIIVDEDAANTKLATPLPDGRKVPLRLGSTLELNDHRAVVVGICKTVRSFQSQPLVYTTYSRVAAFAPAERKRLSFILAKAKPGENLPAVAARIRAITGLHAHSAPAFAAITRQYFIEETGIIGTFLAGIGVSFLVGTVICGQTLYNFTIENLRQFGAIKAMGGSNWTVTSMILCQAGLVGILGVSIGHGLAALFAYALRNTELTLRFSYEQMGLTVVAVILITLLSAALAARKVIQLDPAVVFKG